MNKCEGCGREYTYKRSKGGTARVCGSCFTRKRRAKVRKAAYERAGGARCRLCGYDKCQRALHFHHVDPNTKTMHISAMECMSMATIMAEVDKCVVLCSNCHSEVEDGLAALSPPSDTRSKG